MKSNSTVSPNSLAYDERVFLCLFLHEFVAVYGSTIFVDDSRSIMQDTAPEYHKPEFGVPFRVLVKRNLGSDGKERMKRKFDVFLPNFYGENLPYLAKKFKENIDTENINYATINDKLYHLDSRYGIEMNEFDRCFALCEDEADFARLEARAAITSSLYFEKRNRMLQELDDSSRYITDLYNRLNEINRIYSAHFFIREIVQGPGFMRLYVRN